jgi:hypothetical protein
MAIFNKGIFISIASLLCSMALQAQDYHWFNPGKLPELRFRTAAKEIVVKSKDVQLYTIDLHGAWKKRTGEYDVIGCHFRGLDDNIREFRLYGKDAEIGVAGNDSIVVLPPRLEKPLVLYGTRVNLALLDSLFDRPIILKPTADTLIVGPKLVDSLRNALHEPVGNISTTIPCRQYRELMRYDWDARHREILKMKKSRIVMIGNSITHYWGGLPAAPIARGTDSWPEGAINMGFGWDRIENVLWRVYHDELDGFKAAKIYIMIGTNNLELNTDEDIIAGLRQLVQAIRYRQPKAKILLSGILPRKDQEPRIVRINRGIMQMAGAEKVKFVNPGTVLLKPDATIDASLFTDGLHPNTTGYRKLADYLQPYLQ